MQLAGLEPTMSEPKRVSNIRLDIVADLKMV